MNNILFLIIHPLFIPIHPLEDEWVKIDPHSSPFPIHLLCPDIWTPAHDSYRERQNSFSGLVPGESAYYPTACRRTNIHRQEMFAKAGYWLYCPVLKMLSFRYNFWTLILLYNGRINENRNLGKTASIQSGSLLRMMEWLITFEKDCRSVPFFFKGNQSMETR